MGLYNLVRARVHCGKCGALFDADIQFKYGNLHDHEYGLGSSLVWGRRQVGEPAEAAVIVEGIGECDACQSFLYFDITIRHGVICSIALHSDAVDYYHGHGNYVVVKLDH